MTMFYHVIDLPESIGRIWRRAPLKLTMVALALGFGLPAGTPATAQDYPARDIGEWRLSASQDEKGCFLSRHYDRAGETTLLLGLDVDGTNHLSVLNSNWSIKPKDQLTLNFGLSTGGYSKHFAVGIAADEKQGFVTSFEAKFPSYFATSKFLTISRGKVPVEQLSLDGSGAAIAELRNCVAANRGKPTVRADDQGRDEMIPIDPFAPDTKRKTKK